jgi:hypothetical protein
MALYATPAFTALCAQSKTNKFFESVASQHFQKIYCGSFDRQLLYDHHSKM